MITATHMIIGAGQVGQALNKVLMSAPDIDDQPVYLRDTTHEDHHPDTAEILHITFPWSEGFVDHVDGYVIEYGADLVIVHSTVPAGTCDPHGWVHSPVRGRHPDLVEGLIEFQKPFGGARAEEAAQLFHRVGIATAITPLAVTTEIGKIWELVAYGLTIMTEKAIHQHCHMEGADYDFAYRTMAEQYNEGWLSLNASDYRKPILRHVPGPIGGHCVMPACQMVGEDALGAMVWALNEGEKDSERYIAGQSPLQEEFTDYEILTLGRQREAFEESGTLKPCVPVACPPRFEDIDLPDGDEE